MPECNICVFERKEFVKCSFCQFECCPSCFKKHLLTIKLLQPFCMNCNHQQDLEFVATNTSIRFYNTTYRNHRVRLLFEYEKSLLPETQGEARKLQQKRELYKKHKAIRAEIKKLENRRIELRDIQERSELDDEQINEFQEIIETIWIKETEKMVINRQILGLDRNPNQINYFRTQNIERSAESKYVSHCSTGDCKGFTKRRNTTLKCELCSTTYCLRCHLRLDEEHKCDENAVLTVIELKESTKPCPKCTSSIFKNGGCDQMFCTMCNTAFDWRTGNIVTNNIHNPHYFDYLRSVQRELPVANEEYDRAYAEAVANGTERAFFFQRRGGCVEVNAYSILRYMCYRSGINDDIFPLEQRELLVRDMNYVEEMNNRYNNFHRRLENNKDLRIRYLNSEINDDEFKKRLKYKDKQKEKALALTNLLTMYRETAVLLMRNIYDSGMRKIPDSLVLTFLEEIKGIDDYTEAQLEKIRKRFGGFVPNLFHTRKNKVLPEDVYSNEDILLPEDSNINQDAPQEDDAHRDEDVLQEDDEN